MSSLILDIKKITKIDTTVDNFKVPSNNGVRILNFNTALLRYKPPYYGDEVDMFFWKRLNVLLGDFNPNNTLIYKEDKFRYVYYHDKKRFRIVNDVGLTILDKKVNKLADLCLDFSIYMSHQFEIYVDGSDSSVVYFYLPTRFDYMGVSVDKLCEGTWLNGIIDDPNNPYNPNNPYDPNNPKKPTALLGSFWDYIYWKQQRLVRLKELNKFEGINNHDIIKEMVAEYPFYCDGFNFTQTQIQKIYQNATMFETLFILPLFSLSLFPAFLPIDKEDETRNNRPVYEPFMIWGYFEFIRNKAVFDKIDRYAVDVFDLSPNWGG